MGSGSSELPNCQVTKLPGCEMRIIVDGYNLIRQWPELAMLDGRTFSPAARR